MSPEFPQINPMFFVIMPIIALLFAGMAIWIGWRIATKAGYPGAASLLMLIPLVNIFVYLYFAFSEWPIERELAELRASRTLY